MGGLTELVLSLCALLEAEGKLLQENILRTFLRALLLLVAIVFAVSTLAFCMAGIYELLLPLMPRWLALVCLALLCALISFILFWSSRQWGKKKSVKAATGKNSPD